MCWTSATDRIWRISSGWIKWVTGTEDNIRDPGWSKSKDSKIDSNMPKNSRVKESFTEILQNSTKDTLDKAVVSGEPLKFKPMCKELEIINNQSDNIK